MTIQDDAYNENREKMLSETLFNNSDHPQTKQGTLGRCQRQRVQYLEVVDRFFGWVESMQYEGLEMWDLDWKSIKEELL